MNQVTEVPLIYTSKGNLPIADLEYSHQWMENDDAVIFVEEYRYNGELVKRNSHCKFKKGLDSTLEQQIFG